ncbi:MAG: transcription antitermination factor NusB [Alphaproteobacteria bacterium]|nr:transcription antitermination factor NusB [Alphaproteobacteria bacterium]
MPEPKEKAKSAQKPKDARPKDARVLAHKILLKIIYESVSIEDAWEQTKEVNTLEQRDRSLCRLLVLTTLRQFGFLDYRIRQYAKTLEKLPHTALMALRIGFTHILFLHSPAHAVVNTCVNLLGPHDKVMRGLVNAVLRKAAANEQPIHDATQGWQQALPNWLLNSWKNDYGLENLGKIAQASLREPYLDITVKDNIAHWQKELNAQLLPNGSLRLATQDDITKLPGFAEGEWWVQDVAAALPAMMAGDVKGKLVFDCCAAPGGKTAQFLSKGAKVVAIDQSQSRLQRLRENLQRIKMNANILSVDVLEFKPNNLADVLFLDAPCSATGTLRRHPDLMIHKKPEDVTRLAALQLRMLNHVANFVKKDGLLIYAVCSLQNEEGAGVVDAFLKKNPNYARLPVTAADFGGWEEGVTSAGDLRTLPYYMAAFGGMDGFYAARLKKIA